MSPKQLDIFSGSLDHEPVWLESVEGLATASQRLMERATRVPGSYFVFDTESRNILLHVDTTPKSSGSSSSSS